VASGDPEAAGVLYLEGRVLGLALVEQLNSCLQLGLEGPQDNGLPHGRHHRVPQLLHGCLHQVRLADKGGVLCCSQELVCSGGPQPRCSGSVLSLLPQQRCDCLLWTRGCLVSIGTAHIAFLWHDHSIA
jgi:hypothetical protein